MPCMDPRVITYNGVTKTLCEWARFKGINQSTLRSRLNAGWSVERALSEAPHPIKKAKTRQPGNTLLKDRIVDILDGNDLNLREIYDTIGIEDRKERERVRATLGRLVERHVVSKVGMTPTIPSVGIYHLTKKCEEAMEE